MTYEEIQMLNFNTASIPQLWDAYRYWDEQTQYEDFEGGDPVTAWNVLADLNAVVLTREFFLEEQKQPEFRLLMESLNS